MKAPPRAIGDVLLALFAIAVITACVMVVEASDDPIPVSTLSQSRDTPVRPTATPVVTVSRSASPTPQVTEPTAGPAAVVVAGPDLAKMGSQLVAASGDTVLVAESDGQLPLAAGALEAIDQTPAAVIFQVVAGSNTSVRTTDAVKAVRARWAGVRIVVVGPFGADDRKSAAAVKAAAEAAHVTFLDPVELKWRSDAAQSAVAPADFTTVAAKVAAALD